EDLYLPGRGREAAWPTPLDVRLGELSVPYGRSRRGDPVGQRAQLLQAHARGGQQVAVARLDVALPEDLAEAEPRAQAEDDLDVRAALVQGLDDRFAELDVGHRLERIAVADLEGRGLHPARRGQEHVGEAAGGRVGQLDLGEERQALQRSTAAERVA